MNALQLSEWLLVQGVEAETKKFPVVVSTWPFIEAVRAAWRAVDNGSSAVDAVVEGCSACEQLRCDGTGTKKIISFSLDFSFFFFNFCKK